MAREPGLGAAAADRHFQPLPVRLPAAAGPSCSAPFYLLATLTNVLLLLWEGWRRGVA